ncbi:MAG: DUF4212 domain-containing protein [Phycisphaerales bacterium JB063]
MLDATPPADADPPRPTPPAPDAADPAVQAALARYWRSNITIMAVLLSVWAVVGLGCGVLFADLLNSFRLGGYPLGFWFAQQGSIISFVLIILTYCILLNRLDKKHHQTLQAIRSGESA